MNNQRGPVKEQTGHLVRVRSERVTSHEAVKNQTGIRQSTRLNSQRGDRSRVSSVGSTQPRQRGVVPGPVCATVSVFIAHVGHRRVRQRVPELIKEGVGELDTVLRVGRKTANKLHNKDGLV